MNQRKKTGNPETWKDWEQICADAEKLGSVNKKVELVRVRRNKVELKQTDFENNQESLITEFLLIIKFEMYDLRFEKWSDFEGVEEFEIWVMSNNKIILKFKQFGGERIFCSNFLCTGKCSVVLLGYTVSEILNKDESTDLITWYANIFPQQGECIVIFHEYDGFDSNLDFIYYTQVLEKALSADT